VIAACLQASLCALAAGGAPGKLDPELRRQLWNRIQQQHPDQDLEAKRAILRKIESTPQLHCTITGVTVYADGIACRVTLSCDLPFDCRVSFLGRSLSPVCAARLTDSEANKWAVPRLEAHYYFAPVEEAWTVLIPRGKRVSITHIDVLESPRPVRLGPARGNKADRPKEFHYTITGYSTAYTADLKGRHTVYMTGRGTTPVQWRDSPIPAGTKTGAVVNREPQP
jgi:hypothetical protein